MAIESVTTAVDEPVNGLEALSSYDSTVFVAWALSVADVLSVTDPGDVGKHTVANCGGLIYSLLLSAQELDRKERAEWRARA